MSRKLSNSTRARPTRWIAPLRDRRGGSRRCAESPPSTASAWASCRVSCRWRRWRPWRRARRWRSSAPRSPATTNAAVKTAGDIGRGGASGGGRPPGGTARWCSAAMTAGELRAARIRHDPQGHRGGRRAADRAAVRASASAAASAAKSSTTNTFVHAGQLYDATSAAAQGEGDELQVQHHRQGHRGATSAYQRSSLTRRTTSHREGGELSAMGHRVHQKAARARERRRIVLRCRSEGVTHASRGVRRVRVGAEAREYVATVELLRLRSVSSISVRF